MLGDFVFGGAIVVVTGGVLCVVCSLFLFSFVGVGTVRIVFALIVRCFCLFVRVATGGVLCVVCSVFSLLLLLLQ